MDKMDLMDDMDITTKGRLNILNGVKGKDTTKEYRLQINQNGGR